MPQQTSRTSFCCRPSLQQTDALDCTLGCWRFLSQLFFFLNCSQIDAERSPDEVFAHICQVMETFWYVQSPPTPPSSPESPHLKTLSLSLSLSSISLLYRSKETYPHRPAPQTFTHPTPVVCMSPNTPSSQREPSLSASDTDEVRLSLCASPTCISLLHQPQYMLPTVGPRQMTALKETSIPCCDWEHVPSWMWNLSAISPTPPIKRSRGRVPATLESGNVSVCSSCSHAQHRILYLYRACKNYNQA